MAVAEKLSLKTAADVEKALCELFRVEKLSFFSEIGNVGSIDYGYAKYNIRGFWFRVVGRDGVKFARLDDDPYGPNLHIFNMVKFGTLFADGEFR